MPLKLSWKNNIKHIPYHVYAPCAHGRTCLSARHISIHFLHRFVPSSNYAGFYYEMNEGALMGVALYATSLNYWRHPVMSSRRRTIDTVVAKSSIIYHIYLSFYTTNRGLTTLPFLTGCGLYFASFYLYEKKYVKSAAVCHCLLHALVSIGASMLYKDHYSRKCI